MNKSSEETDKKIVVLRETLINTAVTFLCNKKIENQDPNILRQFLLTKGLTDEEADVAFQRFHASRVTRNSLENNNSLAVAQHLAPPLVPFTQPPSSAWITIQRIATTITSIGAICYAVYWLWKNYISPYLFGRKPKRKPVETSLAELESAVGTCAADIKTIRSSMDKLAEQNVTELTQGVVVRRLQEVKSEVNSLKALLLNRSQFPAVPTPAPSIPVWQLEAEHPGHEPEDEGNGSNGTTNGSDSSLEIVKDPNT